MTIEEKIIEFGLAIAPDIAENDVLQSELMAAETMILNKMYPFGYPDGTEELCRSYADGRVNTEPLPCRKRLEGRNNDEGNRALGDSVLRNKLLFF